MQRIEDQELWARIYLARFEEPFNFDPMAMKLVISDELDEWDEQKIIATMKWMQSSHEEKSWGKKPTAKQIASACKMRDVEQFGKKTILPPCKVAERYFLKIKKFAAERARLTADDYTKIWDLMVAAEDEAGREAISLLEGWCMADTAIQFDRSKTTLWAARNTLRNKMSKCLKSTKEALSC